MTKKRSSLAERQRRRLQGPGRPAGSKHRQYLYADVTVSACPDCGCTDRTPYEQQQTIERSTVVGELRETVILRRCRCLNCGTHRIDRCLEFPAA